ncbi:hypothetical protein C8J57DRAFT_1511871 [Mycena rebaudengoi]|nr:hypothetical protein C8J57DRAFT_1511871 [Mycena rebaudengoi]
MSEEKARQLLDPADKQNVPKAVTLLQQLGNLGNLPIPRNPTFAQERNTIVFFADVLGHFILPFITVDIDLSDQVRSLATYAHLAAALQIKHSSACFTGPLYADSQATIKNIIFIIARMQLINPSLRFWIIHEGTDHLELIFADSCTLDHARNFDIDQLASKLSLSAPISAAFQRNPDLDRGHRRLSLKGALGTDHMNPASCTGNYRVGDVNLACQWEAGCKAANAILKKKIGPGAQVGFIGTLSGSEDLPLPSLEDRDEPLGMDLDDFLPETIQGLDEDAPAPTVDKFLEAADGVKYLKSSLVASLSTNRTKKVTMRTLRAQGVALEDLQKRKSTELDLLNLSDEDVI